MALFICGTDTDAGKTHAAAAILLRYHKSVKNLRYWKPVQTGTDSDDDRAFVRNLSGLSTSYFLPTSFEYSKPLSPHRAAELDGTDCATVSELVKKFNEYAGDGALLIEGAGGLLVPINRKETWVDFLLESGAKVVLVSRSGLGTINHSLLTLRELERNRIDVAGIIYFGPENQDNMKTIEDFSGIKRIGQLSPGGDYLEKAASRLDSNSLLASLF